MYSTIIEIKKSITGDALDNLRQTAEAAFKNHAGSVKNSSTDAYILIFKGGENDYGCLDLSVTELADTNGFREQIVLWNWLDDEESGENCNILELYAEPVY